MRAKQRWAWPKRGRSRSSSSKARMLPIWVRKMLQAEYGRRARQALAQEKQRAADRQGEAIAASKVMVQLSGDRRLPQRLGDLLPPSH